jgi:outer membrane lipoprotein-sorting protein
MQSIEIVSGCRALPRAARLAMLVLFLTGCTVYQPVVVAPSAPSGPSTFDRAWNAALGAADDAGVSVYSSDRTSGVIRGSQGSSDVTIKVYTQADGRVRVEFNVTGPSGTDSVLADRLSTAYDRNMGR